MASELDELLGFVNSPRVDVRRAAVRHVLELTGADETRELLQGTDIVPRLARLVGDVTDVARDAISALVNMSGSAAMSEEMLHANFVERLMQNVMDPEYKLTHLNLMLLSNITQSEEGARQMLQLEVQGGALLGLHVRRLLSWFLHDAVLRQVQADPRKDIFQFVAPILTNVTQLKEGRDLVCKPELSILPQLLPQLQSPSLSRRHGILRTVKNICFDKERHEWLLSDQVGVLKHLLLMIAGPRGYGDMVPTDSSRAEIEDEAVLKGVVESCVLLGVSRHGRDTMREAKVYDVVRDAHRALGELSSVGVERVQTLVDMLMRDEEGEAGAAAAAEEAARSAMGTAPLLGDTAAGGAAAGAAAAPPRPVARVSAVPVMGPSVALPPRSAAAPAAGATASAATATSVAADASDAAGAAVDTAVAAASAEGNKESGGASGAAGLPDAELPEPSLEPVMDELGMD